ncbi:MULTISPECIES: leucyl/phenylalanyl-tRNA--protein transferase [Prosthecochloris]|uniref:Leucyl/phenylalanyl-tRNA--protein transferase n=1 Tax=Prosthecochloris marina TaxID=2017681 RepID=A0A317T4B4_9CHLB|nr:MULTISPECIES: leucyl/phenylalanyl-tRNA--protein transferase [Prosthecochloris]PWW81562.1 leucyl/phenylalanyl-tRNA--protein transferase [Prosthecochloris marina]UZJ37007.1 leucyl/phenylalanyl-tRNA--protein transferase [Prosthecochloris sp. SCSIO W1103]
MLRLDEVLRAYLHGYFPMADPDDEKVYWCQPHRRAIVPLRNYKTSRVVRSLVRKGAFDVYFNRDFGRVIRSCAAPREEESQTWISEEIIATYTELHEQGFAHSVECYRGDELAGGLYGLAIGGAFFGESMFYTVSNASKVAFDILVKHLDKKGYELLDAQIMNSHLEFLGAVEVEHAEYMRQLELALQKKIRFI